jgi:acyl-CoA thioesterase
LRFFPSLRTCNDNTPRRQSPVFTKKEDIFMDSRNQTPTPAQEILWRKLKDRVNQPGQFFTENGMLVTEVGDYWCKGELTVSDASLNPRGIIHGGCLCTLMDTVAGMAACTGGRSCVTLNCSLNYLRPAANTAKVYCNTKLIKRGRTIVVMEAVLTDDQGRELATGTYTFFLMEEVENLLG